MTATWAALPLALLPLTLMAAPPLDLETAWERVCRSGRLDVVIDSLEVKRGEAMQALLWPNPEFVVEVDNLGSNHGFNAVWGDGEISCTVTQLFETGGKRRARADVACAEAEETRCEGAVFSCGLRADVEEAFFAAALLQERLALAERRRLAVVDAAATVDHFLRHGKATALQRRRLAVAERQADLQCMGLAEQLDVAYLALARLWNGCSVDFDGVTCPVYAPPPPPLSSGCSIHYSGSFERQRAAAAVTTAEAMLRRQCAERYPDIELAFGYNLFCELREHAYTFGIALPLPLFDNNQGNIHSATAHLRRTQQLSLRVDAEVATALSIAYRQCEGAYHHVTVYADDILPDAEAVFAAAEEGYQRGRLPYLELLEAEQQLFDARAAHLDALHAYYRSLAALRRLTTTEDSSV